MYHPKPANDVEKVIGVREGIRAFEEREGKRRESVRESTGIIH
jgi:hypothetical protein